MNKIPFYLMMLIGVFSLPVSSHEDFDPVVRSSIPFAKELLNKKGGVEAYQGLDEFELGKKLNALVYSHCKNEQPHTGLKDQNELFDNCRTACGGYAYVLRGLFASLGYKTRYLNLYNLPNQGNHTLIEVQWEDKTWSAFDPTFGTYFADNKNGKPLSIGELRFNHSESSIEKVSFTVINEDAINLSTGIDRAYSSGQFNFQFMSLVNYLRAEQARPVGNTPITPLVIPLQLNEGVAQLNNYQYGSGGDGRPEFLTASNKSLLDQEPENDYSYLAHVGGTHAYFKAVNIVEMAGLAAGEKYKISVIGFSDKPISLEMSSIGRKAIMRDAEVRKLQKGEFLTDFLIKANADRAMFIIEARDKAQFRINNIKVATYIGE